MGEQRCNGLSTDTYINTEAEAFTPRVGAPPRPIGIGMYHFDRNIPGGIEIDTPNIVVLQGAMGSRKTTGALNWIWHMGMGNLLPADHKMYYWSAETSMTVERIMLILRCMMTSKLLLYTYYSPNHNLEQFHNLFNGQTDFSSDPQAFLEITGQIKQGAQRLFLEDLPQTNLPQTIAAVSSEGKQELDLSAPIVKKILKWPNTYGFATKRQQSAWIISGYLLGSLPLTVFGTSEHSNREERARRSTHTTDIKLAVETWDRLAGNGSCQIFLDHMMAMNPPGVSGRDLSARSTYDIQKVVVPAVKEIAMAHAMPFWIITQEGTGQQREFAATGVTRGSDGGDFAGRESDLNMKVGYLKEVDPYVAIYYSNVKSRLGEYPGFVQPMEPNSGVFWGRSILKSDYDAGTR